MKAGVRDSESRGSGFGARDSSTKHEAQITNPEVSGEKNKMNAEAKAKS